MALIQSESVSQSIGMNMKGLYYPSVRMNQVLRECRDVGQSRIEITYTAANTDGEDEILNCFFPARAQIDLNKAEDALNQVANIGWHLPLQELLDSFVAATKRNQLLIVQPALVAMIYAINAKPGLWPAMGAYSQPWPALASKT